MWNWVRKFVVFLLIMRLFIPLVRHYYFGNISMSMYAEMSLWYILFLLLIYFALYRFSWEGKRLSKGLVFSLLIYGVFTKLIQLPNTLSNIGYYAPIITALAVLKDGRRYNFREIVMMLIILSLSVSSVFRQNILIVLLALFIVYTAKNRMIVYISILALPIVLYSLTNLVLSTRYGKTVKLDKEVFLQSIFARLDPLDAYNYSEIVQEYPVMEAELASAMTPSFLGGKKRVAPGQYFAKEIGNNGVVGGERISIALGISGILNIYTWPQRLIVLISVILWFSFLRLSFVPAVLKYFVLSVIVLETARGFESLAFGFVPLIVQTALLTVLYNIYEILFNHRQRRA